MAGKGGGAWKVAYADFVTAMMAFFMVMWIVGQSKQVKQAVAQYFNNPGKPNKSAKPDPKATPDDAGGVGNAFKMELPKSAAQGPGRGLIHSGLRQPRPEDAKGAPSRKPTVFAIHDGDKQMTGAVVLFPENSDELNDAGRTELKRILPNLQGKRNKIEIRGHASRRPPPPGATHQDQWQLSYARSIATMKYLEQQGIESDRIRLSQAGPYEPFTLRLEAEKQAQNSRVEVYLLAEMADELAGTREERAERVKAPGAKIP